MRSMWKLQLVQSPVFLRRSNLTKGLQRQRLHVCVLDSIHTCILICHTRTLGTGRRETPLPHRVGCSHLGVVAADVAQRMMLAQSQYLDSYQPIDLDKWQQHFPGTLKKQKAIYNSGLQPAKHPPDLPDPGLNCQSLLCAAHDTNRKWM